MPRPRLAVVVAASAAALVLIAGAALWTQRGLLRTAAAHLVRERLASELGLEYEIGKASWRWLPPAVSLGRVSLHRRGEPWVLTAEDLRVSFNLYGVLFGKERAGRVVLERPHLFLRRPSQPRPEPPAGGARESDLAEAVRRLFAPPLPLRALEIVDGRVDYRDGDGRLFRASGIGLALYVGRGLARGTLAAGSASVELDGRRVQLGRVSSTLVLERTGLRMKDLSISGAWLDLEAQGSVGLDGGLSLAAESRVRIDQALAALGARVPLAGTLRYAGRVEGRLSAPRLEGAVSIGSPRFGAARLPGGEGLLRWDGREIAVDALRFAAGRGIVNASARVDVAASPPGYRLEAELRAPALGEVPGFEGTKLAAVRDLAGTLAWAGAGVPGRGGSGSGRLAVGFVHPALPEVPLVMEAEGVLSGDGIEIPAFRATAPMAGIRGRARWQPGLPVSGTLEGEAEDVGALMRDAKVPISGEAAVSGAFTLAREGFRFEGGLRAARLGVAGLPPASAGARLEVAPGEVRIGEGSIAWAGGTASVEGLVGVPAGELDLRLAFRGIELGRVAAALAPRAAELRGVAAGEVSVGGTLRSPELEGAVTAEGLGAAGLPGARATARFDVGGGSLRFAEAQLAAGGTVLLAEGRIGADGSVAARFTCAEFDLRDIAPETGLQVAGSVEGSVAGTLLAPEVSARLRTSRLRGGGWDFGQGRIAAELRGGVVALRGHVAGEANRLRAVIEPRRGWRFEAEIDMERFAPTIVRDGPSPLPRAVVLALGEASVLATGRLRVQGALGDPATLRGSLGLETLWIHAGGRSLQNRGPVRISWSRGGLRVDELRLAGDQYHLDVAGGGSAESGWDLVAEGAVNLALLRGYSEAVEEADGFGDIRLRLTGPWSEPAPEGTVAIRAGTLKLALLPEPLEGVEGLVTLGRGAVEARGLTWRIGGDPFRGAGSYRLRDGHLDARIEGRLDLSVFRARLGAARELQGPVEVDLRLLGPLSAPALTGTFDVQGAELVLRAFPARIGRLRGRVLLEPGRVRIPGLEGQVGGGTVRLGGAVALGATAGRVDLDLEGDGVQLALAGDFKVQADLRVGLHGTPGDLALTGEVQLLKGRYLREFGERAPRVPGVRDDAQADQLGLASAALDVRILAADNFWIANRTARIEAAADLALGGTLASPTLSGEVQGIRGEAFYLSREFRLESGTLRFTPEERTPELSLQASTTVGEVQVLFLLEGPLNKLAYHITSVPPLAQEDLVALITVGETRGGLAEGGDRAAAAGAARLGTGALVGAIGGEFRSAMGVEILQLEPVVGEDNQLSARVTVGTHLSDRLFASYSQTLGATEDQQFKVEYAILDYLALWGQELRQGVYSLDLVFRHVFH